ncbi:MAG TPA: 4-hydroxythreonine-4-phosphate dehydrogenase PdxA [Steroidobacteraceae bacterium]|nr:4-hydroxythreonine-4-phosphate dehydrogenase PdxA [Steroidobacteraceae bacterium]
MRRPRLIVTSGEPAGIGPDLCLALSERRFDADLVIACDAEVLQQRAGILKVRENLSPYDCSSPTPAQLLHIPVAAPVEAGVLNPRNARYVLDLLDRAIEGSTNGEFDAIVTAPVQKSIINDAGIKFSGHTEYLAERTHTPLPVMMLASEELRVALATTHLPLRAVSDAITTELLIEVLSIIDRDLRARFGLADPRILICGLNPHAGESGHLGREEIEIIAPTIAMLKKRGLNLNGPVPADTAFTPRMLQQADAVLAMYHDQGLAVIKHAAFDTAVNVTLGLPIIRTSVDHGTALALAGTGKAEVGSLIAAIEMACELVRHSETHRQA